MQEDDDNDLMKHHGVETSILLHLFRRGGAGELEFKQFCTFMNNLQSGCRRGSRMRRGSPSRSSKTS